MKIDNYHVEQQGQSSHQRIEKHAVALEVKPGMKQDQVNISQDGLRLQALEEEKEDYLSEMDQRKIDLLETFLSWLLGEEFKFGGILSHKLRHVQDKDQAGQDKTDDPPEEDGLVKKAQALENQGMSLHYKTTYEIFEREEVSFTSKGKIQTEDGRSIDFNLNMHMSRETYAKHETSLRVESFQDPLVMNFDGKGIDFSDESLEIDLNLDGKMDQLKFLGEGNGFLVLDKNGNGSIDDGSEMFGPQTNQGFRELAQYDLDGNGWIDENDAVFDSLKIWTLDGSGEKTLVGLKDKDVGAIYLGAVDTKYTYKDGGLDLGRLSSSSVYLKENGDAHRIHQFDYKI